MFLSVDNIAIVSIFLVILNFSAINCIEFTSCSSYAHGTLTKIEVSNCDDSKSVCPFKKNKDVSLNLSFKTGKSLKSFSIAILLNF